MKKRIFAMLLAVILILAMMPAAASAAAVQNQNPFVAVASGGSASYALQRDGTLWAWGYSQKGQLGNGIAGLDPENPRRIYRELEPIIIMDSVKDIVSGVEHALALKFDGSLWAWGCNYSGQLGTGVSGGDESDFDEGIDQSRPVKIMENVVQISANDSNSGAVTADGELFIWGSMVQTTPMLLADGVEKAEVVPAGSTLILYKDGTVGRQSIGYHTGEMQYREIDLKNIVDIAVNNVSQAALDSSGNVYAWNTVSWTFEGSWATLTREPAIVATDVKSMALGTKLMVIKNDGSLWEILGEYAWTIVIPFYHETGQFGESVLIDWPDREMPFYMLDNCVTVAHNIIGLAILEDGSVWSFGNSPNLGLRPEHPSLEIHEYKTDKDPQVAPVLVINSSGEYVGIIPEREIPTNPIDSAAPWARDGILSAIGKGFVPSELQSNYSNVITRAEFARLAVGYLEFASEEAIADIVAERGDPEKLSHTFSDTSDSFILAAYRLGIISGTRTPADGMPGTFDPGGQFTREQAATMLMNLCRVLDIEVDNAPDSGFSDINLAASWAIGGINFVRAQGYMVGSGGNFNPRGTYTRQESIMMFDNMGSN